MLGSFERRNQNFGQTDLFYHLFAFIGRDIDLHIPNLDSLNVLRVIETDFVMGNIVSVTVYENVRSPPEIDRVARTNWAPVC